MSLKTLYVDICSPAPNSTLITSDSDSDMNNSEPDEHEDPLVCKVPRSKKRFKCVVVPRSSPINKAGRPTLARTRKFYPPKSVVALTLEKDANFVKPKLGPLQSALRRGPRHAFNTLSNEHITLKPNVGGQTKVYDTMNFKNEIFNENKSNMYGKDINATNQPINTEEGINIGKHSSPYAHETHSPDRCSTPERSCTPSDLECLDSHDFNEIDVAVEKKKAQLTASNFKHEKKSENFKKSSNLGRERSCEGYSCNRIKCKFLALTKKELVEHKKMAHNDNKDYCCDKCSYIAMRPSELKKHFLWHSDELIFTCDYEDCDYTGKHKQNLVYHKKKMHPTGEPIKCDFRDCDYRTLFAPTLKVHMMKRHGGAKTIACKLCSYRCHFERELRKHLLCHSNDRPYQCDYEGCNYACKISSNLTKHKRMHTQEKPFACDQCTFRSNFINSLKAHKRTHTNERPFCCDHCGYRCNSSSNLKKHVLLKHPGAIYVPMKEIRQPVKIDPDHGPKINEMTAPNEINCV